jgi:K+-transporting ATPase ATPase C chain
MMFLLFLTNYLMRELRAYMLKTARTSIVLFTLLTVLTGLIYPFVITSIAQVLFPQQANGSLIKAPDGNILGSKLIGQSFDDPKYFWGRLSATAGNPYNAAASGGSNMSVSNQELLDQVQARIDALHAADPTNTLSIPGDLVTASASGLDPDISIASANYQAARVARVRNIAIETVKSLIDQNTSGRVLGFIGEPRVNVLNLNIALDALK